MNETDNDPPVETPPAHAWPHWWKEGVHAPAQGTSSYVCARCGRTLIAHYRVTPAEHVGGQGGRDIADIACSAPVLVAGVEGGWRRSEPPVAHYGAALLRGSPGTGRYEYRNAVTGAYLSATDVAEAVEEENLTLFDLPVPAPTPIEIVLWVRHDAAIPEDCAMAERVISSGDAGGRGATYLIRTFASLDDVHTWARERSEVVFSRVGALYREAALLEHAARILDPHSPTLMALGLCPPAMRWAPDGKKLRWALALANTPEKVAALLDGVCAVASMYSKLAGPRTR